MRVSSDQLFEDVRRQDPEAAAPMEALLRRLAAIAPEADRTGEIPSEVWSSIPADFLNRMNVPLAYGGLSLMATAVRRVTLAERLGRICPGLVVGLSGPGLSAPPVVSLGTEEQKAAYFRRFVGHDVPVWGAFAITEPQGGSDATAMHTVAKRMGDGYVISGEKCFITCAARASVYVVFATLDPSKGRFAIRAFVVPRDTPGLTASRCEDMLGLRASQLCSVSFADCEVPAESMLGHTGRRGPLMDAFTGAQGAWDYMRPVLAALMNGSCVGAIDYAEACLASGEAALPHAKIESTRAELRTFRARVYSSQMLATRAAWKYDRGESSSMDASMAKAFASTLSMELAHRLATTFALQSVTRGNPLEKFLRDAKGFDIIEGTGDMQRLLVARAYAA